MAPSRSTGGGWALIPDLIDAGQKDLLLPVGIHQATLAEVEAALVQTQPTYQRRVELWGLFNQFLTLVKGYVPVDHVFLDGSFVTSRPAPKDTDVSIWVDAEGIDALTPAQQQAFGLLWSQRMSRFHCDAYLVTPCAPAHPAHKTYLHWKNATETSWPAYKNRAKLIVAGVTKGYIEVMT